MLLRADVFDISALFSTYGCPFVKIYSLEFCIYARYNNLDIIQRRIIMTFSEIFKFHRKSCSYTQEEIAAILNVTSQAVSKWETGNAMPDITLLVPISRLFGITTDELLGNNYKDCEEINDELYETSVSKITAEEKYKKYLEMLKLYPHSADVYARLIQCVYAILKLKGKGMSAEEREDYIKAAERYSENMRKVGERKGEDYTFSHGIMAQVYMCVEEYEKAEGEINHLPYCRYGKSRMLGDLRQRENKWSEALEQYRESISDALRWLCYDIECSAYCNWKLTDDNSYSMKLFKLEYDLIHFLYNDNMFPLPLSGELINANRQLAAHCSRIGAVEDAFMHIEEMIRLAEEYEKQYGKNFETGCILYPNAMPPYDNNRIPKGSFKGRILKALNWNAFESIRNDERFNKLFERAEKLK